MPAHHGPPPEGSPVARPSDVRRTHSRDTPATTSEEARSPTPTCGLADAGPNKQTRTGSVESQDEQCYRWDRLHGRGRLSCQ
jgi:hypothetical protein